MRKYSQEAARNPKGASGPWVRVTATNRRYAGTEPRCHLSLRQQGWNIQIDSVRETFGADGSFAGIAWLEWPEEGSTLPGTSHIDPAYRNSQSSRLLLHCG